MTFNRVKLGRAVTFIKYLASVVSLIFLAKTLIWNKITFSASNSPDEEHLQKNLPILRFLSLLIVKISRAYNKTTRELYKNPHQYTL